MRINTALGNRPGMAGSYHQLGLVAQARGDYDAALKYLEQSLAIQREIGDRAGEGTTLNNLATTAYARGDYDAALDWYRKSLAISEQLGDRAGMARSFSQIGVLYTQVRQAAAAVPLNLRSLALRLEIQSPDVRIDLHWLSRQRQILGVDAFRDIVAEHCDVEGTTQVLALVDEFDRRQTTGADPQHPPLA